MAAKIPASRELCMLIWLLGVGGGHTVTRLVVLSVPREFIIRGRELALLDPFNDHALRSAIIATTTKF